MLNLWCADGMRCVKMPDVQRVRFLNPIMDSEFRKALETLALSHDTQKKAVSINFVGEGKRNVRVGYVIENPIWKTSYRLVLDKKRKPFFRAGRSSRTPPTRTGKTCAWPWCRGRPISFQMDLYQSALCAAAGRAGTVRLAAAVDLQRRSEQGMKCSRSRTPSRERPLRPRSMAAD